MSLSWFKTQLPVIEEAQQHDLPELANIHSACFTHGWGTAELASLYGQIGVFFLAAWVGSTPQRRELVGFLAIRSVAGEAEVLTIAVHPRHRGRGIARKLMHDGIFRLYSERAEVLFLEVDEANTAAVTLYKKLGFKQVGVRKGYYSASEGSGTALVMRCELR
ncbi:ribosomal protein S18-alanine N-acetyltransferase [Pseudovibrio exalbescens]|uniref:Ribosomal-protein-alanine N-acetyltransferase n=1 Tax=Pseudovibrio exalbescens TaxID=197461 RepID=A0A1U7JID4_9HYPH|nr:ribosomal protein S18-alanine N-acetyltransferase [Pseudovibrio exalbescens]OKL44477.1 ribosomal-protein-alanine N-acetyltransferase [Pseudovibrio exalbescens]